MRWLPFVILFLLGGGLAVSMIRGGRWGERYHKGGRAWLDRDGQGRPVEPTDNVRSQQWGGTTLDD